MNLVNNIFGTNLNDGVQLAIIFATLLVVLLLVVWLIRVVFGNNVSRMAKNRQPRLAVTDAAIVDDKRRLVLVRRDNVEHLILIGGNSDVLLESNISRVTPVQVPSTETIAESKQQKKSNLKERDSKKRPKPFSTIASGAEKAGNLGIGTAAGLTVVGAGAIAAVSNTAAKTVDTAASASGSIAEVAKETASTIVNAGDAVTSKSTSALSSVKDTIVDTATQTTKTASNVASETAEIIKDTNYFDNDKNVVADEPIVDKIKEVTLGQDVSSEKNIGEKSTAELDLEKALADETMPSKNSASEDDMQKILDELTADIK